MTRPVIVALDLDNEKKLNELLPKLGKPENVFIKIGMELFSMKVLQLLEIYLNKATKFF